MSFLKNFLFGKPDKISQIPTQSPQQQAFLNQILQMLSGGMGGQGLQQGLQYYLDLLSNEPGAFEQFEAPIKRQFQEEVIPGLTERFSGAGAKSSSGFQQTLARAGERLSENLAAQRAQLKGGAAQGLLGNFQGLAGLGLGTRTSTPWLQQGTSGFLGGLGGSNMSGLGRLLAMLGG